MTSTAACVSDIESPANLWAAFAAAVSAAPDAPALVLADETITFAQLHGDATRAASWLSSQGYTHGSVVALQLPKMRDTYAIWLACLRQGLIYVFVDPHNPAARTDQIIERVRPVIFATTGEATNPYGVIIRMADGVPPWRASPGGAPPAPADVHGLSPAYIMFTSGSTGEPKGAVIPHQGVLSLMRWARSCIPRIRSERFSNLNPLHFDNSVFDLYCGLLNGAALVPVETGSLHNPMLWIRRLRSGCASVMFAVPTLFQTLERIRLLTPDSLPDASVFLFGGEGFPIDSLRRFYAAFRGRARLVNVYGPTETSCICSSIEIDDGVLERSGSGLAPLGRMHMDFAYAVLDADGSPVAAGQTGELWIGGGNVGLGYFRNPAETESRFRQDPRQNAYRSIWYRSGDLVCEDANRWLWFQGRADNQVKVRGHRIELEEIDLVLQAMPGVSRAVTAVVAGADGPELRAAFEAPSVVDVDALRAHCDARLAPYMRPSAVVQLDALPTNANGKIDRRAAAALLARLESCP